LENERREEEEKKPTDINHTYDPTWRAVPLARGKKRWKKSKRVISRRHRRHLYNTHNNNIIVHIRITVYRRPQSGQFSVDDCWYDYIRYEQYSIRHDWLYGYTSYASWAHDVWVGKGGLLWKRRDVFWEELNGGETTTTACVYRNPDRKINVTYRICTLIISHVYLRICIGYNMLQLAVDSLPQRILFIIIIIVVVQSSSSHRPMIDYNHYYYYCYYCRRRYLYTQYNIIIVVVSLRHVSEVYTVPDIWTGNNIIYYYYNNGGGSVFFLLSSCPSYRSVAARHRLVIPARWTVMHVRVHFCRRRVFWQRRF